MEVTLADEKRHDGTSDICHRIHVSLWDMSSQAQALPYAPRPGLHPGHDVPAAQHKMELPAGGAARNPRPAGDNGHNADAMGRKNDTKSASRCIVKAYARHQMEQPCSQGFSCMASPMALGRRIIQPSAPPPEEGEVRCRERLGGLLKTYYREAA